MKKISIILFSCLSLVSCGAKFKERFGMVSSGPNEYKVQKNKPLETPPHYYLPKPSGEKEAEKASDPSKDKTESGK